MVFPATLKHYDASGTLIRVIEIGADQKIISVTSYNDGQGSESQIPAKVEVYPQGSDKLHAVLTYDAQGKLIQMEVYNYDAGGVTYPGSPQPTLLQKFLTAYGNKMPPAWRTFLTELSKKPEPEWSKNLKKFSSDLQKKVKAFSKKAQTKKR